MCAHRAIKNRNNNRMVTNQSNHSKRLRHCEELLCAIRKKNEKKKGNSKIVGTNPSNHSR